MPGPVLILGGYGNFGKRIAEALADDNIPIIIAGRNAEKAKALAASFSGPVEIAIFDIRTDLGVQLEAYKPSVVINTCGPFQNSNYAVAETCIAHGVHYIDLADGRDFVVGISALNDAAVRAGVCVIAGASTVPGLSSAVLAHFSDDFGSLDHMRYGISPGQGTERGLATTQGIMSYVGKPLKPFSGQTREIYGWQNLYRQPYPGLGKRWMANCDIPDLDLLPQHFGLKSIQFSAGLELSILHLGTWALSWLVRLGLPLNLPKHASLLLRMSDAFNRFGSDDGGMHVTLSGTTKDGRKKTLTWTIIAKDGDGPYIPTIPAVILAKRLHSRGDVPAGAQACVGMIKLEDYLAALDGKAIETYVT
jgi:hypothetical protein